ncbi:MAG: cobalamin-binding protein [Candidatus Anammoximicrobium sp.]|nr:cobalamin-binding protein [Candidatus Anammoximicrobium sp.]
MPDLQKLSEAIKSGNREQAVATTQEAIAAKAAPREILDAMVAAMDDVGRKFQCNEIFVPEMLIAARAMKESMAQLEPLLVEAGIKPIAKAVIGTVAGDLHDIGKNLVAMMWKGANFDVVDLGTNVSPQKFVDAAKQHNADLVGLSALLTTTMPAIKTTVEAIKNAGLNVTKVVIGGAPVTQAYADQVGADGYAPDAASAVDVARKLLNAAA